MFKMFVEFGDQHISWEDKKRTIDLNNELEENKNINICLEEKLKISQVSVQKLEGKLKKLNDTLKSKDITVSDLEEQVGTLEELNKFLSAENQLHQQNFGNDSKNQIKNLNKKLDDLSEQLECQIVKNIQLENQIIQPKSFIEQIKNRDKDLENGDFEEYKNLDSKTIVGNSNDNDNKNIEEQAEETLPKTTKLNTVVVSNYRVSDLRKHPLEAIIIFLARKMGLTLLKHQIRKVITIQHDSKSASLIVTFNNIDTKKAFILNKYRLKHNSNTKFLKIETEEEAEEYFNSN